MIVVICTAALAAPSATAAVDPPEKRFSVRGASGPGPSRYDRVFVTRFGHPSADRALVLVPGSDSGPGIFHVLARELVNRVPDLQVWTLGRRELAFQDTSVLEQGDPERTAAYYLPPFRRVGGRSFEPVEGGDVPYVREWGLELSLDDMRQVIRLARAGGRRKVVLGGHSLGGSTSVAYAMWDFAGRAGYRDLSGLMLIDGGLLQSFKRTYYHASLGEVRRQLEALKTGDPFVDLLGLGLPWAAGVFPATVAQYARVAPDAPSALQSYPLLPPHIAPSFPVTNQALLGFAFSPSAASGGPSGLLQFLAIHAGKLERSGSPRGWDDRGAIVPIRRVASAFSEARDTALEWYYPQRLETDVLGADSLPLRQSNELERLRLRHLHAIDVPLYAFGTGATKGGVIEGAKRLEHSSRIPRATFAQDTKMSHIDPLLAEPERNRFLTGAVRFLRTQR